MAKRKPSSESAAIIPVDVTTREWLDLDWPMASDAMLQGQPIVRFTIRARTAAEASTADESSRAWAMKHGAYKIAHARRIIYAAREVKMVLPQEVTDDPGSAAHDPALVRQYAEKFPPPEGLKVETILKMMGYDAISAGFVIGRPFTRLRNARFKDVSLFRELDVTLPDDPLVALTGDIGQGKSAFAELAIPYALAGELRSGTVEKLGHRYEGKPSPTFSALVEFDLTDGRIARIERGREKKQAVLNVHIDGQPDAQGAQAEAFIRDHIMGGRTIADLLTAPFIRQGDIHQFSTALKSARRQVMAGWFHLDRFDDGYRSTVAEKIKAVEPDTILHGPTVEEAETALIGADASARVAVDAIGNAKYDLEAARGDLAVLEVKVHVVDHGPRLRELRGLVAVAEGLPVARKVAQDAKTVAGKAQGALEAARSRHEAALRAGTGQDQTARAREIRRVLDAAEARDVVRRRLATVDGTALEADLARLQAALPTMREEQTIAAADHREARAALAGIAARIKTGFDGVCPVDDGACPRKDEINDNTVCAAKQKAECEIRLKARKATHETVDAAFEKAEAEIARLTATRDAIDADKREIARLEGELAGADLPALRVELAGILEAEAQQKTAATAITDAARAVKDAEATANVALVAEAVAQKALEDAEAAVAGKDIPGARAEIARLDVESADATTKAATLQPKIDAARVRVKALEATLADANRAQGLADASVTQAQTVLAYSKTDAANVEQAKVLLRRLQWVERMCSPDGLPALILENLVAGVEQTANDLLARMDYPLQVQFSFESETGDKAKLCDCGAEFPLKSRKCPACGAPRGNRKTGDLEIQIVDASGPHEFLEESGGRRALVSVAVRLAVARLLGFRWCVTDEIDSALSDEMVPRLAQMLRALPEMGFVQVLVMSHRTANAETLGRCLRFERDEHFAGTASWAA